MRRVRAFVEKQGFFILLAVCLLVIAVSGVWAYAAREAGETGAVGAADAAAAQAGRLADAERLRVTPPVAGAVIGEFARVGWSETLQRWGAHEGIDIAAAKGTSVLAARDGVVTQIVRDGQWGGVVELTHAAGLRTVYRALVWPLAVAVGERVAAGQRIGTLGMAPAESADAPHLHFEMMDAGLAVDPAPHIMD